MFQDNLNIGARIAQWGVIAIASFFRSIKSGMFAALALLLVWSAPAQAQSSACPTQTASISAGATTSFDMFNCSQFGMVQNVPPSHGSITLTAGMTLVTYSNWDDGATSDTFTLKDENNLPVVYNITIGASNSALQVSPTTLTNPVLGSAYSQQLTTTGGSGGYTYTLNSGSLPGGLGMSSSGLISGTPTATGTFSFTVKSTDSTSQTKLKTYVVAIANPTITASPGSTTFNGTRTIAFSQQLTGGGGTAPYTFSVDTGPMPPGITLGSTGLISGTPTTAATYPIVVKVTDSSGGGGPYLSLISYTIAIANLPPVPIATASSATVAYNSAGTNTALTLSGGTATSVTVATQATHGVATASGTTISYKPTTNYAGPDSFTYFVTNLGGNSSTVTVTVTVSPPPAVTLSPAANSTFNAVAGTAFSQTFTGGGGSGSYTYSLTGTPPTGVSFNGSSGVLSGTPLATGSFPFSITASDTSTGNGPFSLQQTYTLTVAAPTISVSIGATTLQRGVPASQQASASGGSPAYTFAVTGGALPTGLNLTTTTGAITGTPSVAGAYSFTLTATDVNGFTGAQLFSGNVGAGAPIAAASNSTVAYNSGASSYTIGASLSGGITTLLSVTTGATHGSVTVLSASSFSYTPTTGYAGADSFSYTATNAVGTSGTATVSITVSPPTLSLSPASSALSGAVGTAFAQTFTASGGVPTYVYAQTGSLPTGVTFNAGTATVSGTPTQAGTFNFTITVLNDGSSGTGIPFTTSRNYALTVSAPTLGISPTVLTQPQVGIAFSQALNTTGGTAPYSYAVTAGSMPTGLSLVSGVISGTPTTSGSYNVTVTSTDTNGFTTPVTYSGSVGAGKPVPAASSATVAYGSSSNAITTTISGGTATSLTISTAALHGTASVSGTTLSYTPNVGYTGTDSFSYTATNAVGTSSPAIISITVGAPTVIITPSTGWGASQSVAYSQTLTWSGGTAPYSIAVVTGLPSGLSVTGTTSTSLTISGTPTQFGTFSVGVSAIDSTTPTPVTKAQTFSLTVGQAAPVAIADAITTNANQAVSIPVTNNDTGAITSITIASPPAHGTAVVNSLAVLYTPANNYFGTDSFTYTATGPAGTSAAATVSMTVAALGVPTSPAQRASVPPAQAVTLRVGAAAANGPITAVNIVGAPTSGTAVVSGTDIVYTSVSGYSGNVVISYTLSNAFGTSAPITATVTVGAKPVATNQSASGAANTVVVVDLMNGATGGPFTAAAVGTITPSTAGTATISNSSTGSPAYRLTFTPTTTFAGVATVTYTLSNTSGVSAAATVSITVAARTNVANDTQVRGLVSAHGETASRFATAQLGNFSRRLEALHGAGWARSSFGLGLTPTTTQEKPLLAKWSDDEADRVIGSPWQASMRKVGWPLSTRAGNAETKLAAANTKDLTGLPELPGKAEDRKQELSLWIAGTVDFGHRNATGQQDGFRFTTNGVSMGADYRISDKLSVGVGTGYSRDRSDIGENGSKSIGQSVVATVYGTVRPTPNIFVDGLLGYGMLDFDSTRYVTDDGSFATGQRSGTQMFVAVSGGYEFRYDNFLWSPYGKLDLASTTLAQYTETASGLNALTYYKQRARTSSGTLGMRAEGQYQSRVGTWNPRVRIEYRRQFSGADEAGISYADQTTAGPAYVIRSADSFTGNWTAGVGTKLLLANGMSLIVDYSSNLNVGQGRYQSVLFGLNVPLR